MLPPPNDASDWVALTDDALPVESLTSWVTTERVSLSAVGEQGNGDSYNPAISADGRYIAFTSSASNLTAGDGNADLDIFVRDRVAHTTVLASVGPHGTMGDGPSVGTVDGDGRQAPSRPLPRLRRAQRRRM